MLDDLFDLLILRRYWPTLHGREVHVETQSGAFVVGEDRYGALIIRRQASAQTLARCREPGAVVKTIGLPWPELGRRRRPSSARP